MKASVLEPLLHIFVKYNILCCKQAIKLKINSIVHFTMILRDINHNSHIISLAKGNFISIVDNEEYSIVYEHLCNRNIDFNLINVKNIELTFYELYGPNNVNKIKNTKEYFQLFKTLHEVNIDTSKIVKYNNMPDVINALNLQWW